MAARPCAQRGAAIALLLWRLLCVEAITDDAADVNLFAASAVNIVEAENVGGDDFVNAVFNGDGQRFSRGSEQPGSLTYEANATSGFRTIEVKFFFYNPDVLPVWQVNLRLDDDIVFEVDSQALDNALAKSRTTSKDVIEVPGATVNFEVGVLEAQDWHTGIFKVNALSVGCKRQFTMNITGGTADDYWAFQISSVSWSDVLESDVCSFNNDPTACPIQSTQECTPVDPDVQRIFYDEASTPLPLFQSSNIGVATDNKMYFNDDANRYTRSDPSLSGTLTYRFTEGGMSEVRVSVALWFPDQSQLRRAQLLIRPYTNQRCRPDPTSTQFDRLEPQDMANGWQFLEIVYSVGPLPGLGCRLARYVELSFFAPEGSDLQIMAVKLVGEGDVDNLRELESLNAVGGGSGGSSDMLYIWIVVGVVGALLVVIALGVAWKCWGKPCCGGAAAAPADGVVHGADGKKAQSLYIPVNCDLPDPERGLAPSHHHGRGTAAVGGLVFDSNNFNKPVFGAPQTELSSRGAPLPPPPAEAGYMPEPVIDLSVPNGGQAFVAYPYQHYSRQPSVPRELAPRQDIFDTWQHDGLSSYQSGEDFDGSGPLDTRQGSYTANPPMSSGNTGASHASSAIGVTAQLGMRLSELRGLQTDHERVAQGELDSRGEMHVPPQGLGVVYGKKIGVGGFGAVYEGEWNGKVVAIKVIKMPYTATAGEEKDKMAFMEYAISGILVHENIVQTYQADIRPVFLEEDGTATGPMSRSSWTGLGEFLSNEAISQQMRQSMRIHEWQIRLVMEYCNRGNLKEAIRRGALMTGGLTRALDVALLALDIAKGCQAIHKYKIIHGDLKPHNVLITSDADDVRGWVGKIADFGLSVKIKRGEEHVSGIQHGTEGYVAPEVLQTRRMVKASDVYSFGIIMWELWHSKLYYEEHRNAVKRMRRVTLDFRPTFERGCPEEWMSLAKSCWSLRPEERPDFDRVVKMMHMIISLIREQVTEEGVLR